MKIAILGCGPAGLIAAESAAQHAKRGTTIDVFSKKERSVMPGAQYLHAPIPNISPTEPLGQLKYIKIGDRSGYAAKVYGDPEAPVSWDTYEAGHFTAWSMQETYDRLWEKWEKRVEDVDFIGQLDTLRYAADRYDLVISTVPAPLWCDGRHEFKTQKVWICEGSQHAPPNSIIYNGRLNDPWYRSSNIFGHKSTEYAVPVLGGREGNKPLKTDCNCPPPNVVRSGRFGKWNKSALVHFSYPEARRALLNVQ